MPGFRAEFRDSPNKSRVSCTTSGKCWPSPDGCGSPPIFDGWGGLVIIRKSFPSISHVVMGAAVLSTATTSMAFWPPGMRSRPSCNVAKFRGDSAWIVGQSETVVNRLEVRALCAYSISALVEGARGTPISVSTSASDCCRSRSERRYFLSRPSSFLAARSPRRPLRCEDRNSACPDFLYPAAGGCAARATGTAVCGPENLNAAFGNS